MSKQREHLQLFPDGTPVKLTAMEAMKAINAPDSKVSSDVRARFMELFTSMKSHVTSQYRISVAMKEIEEKKDYNLFGYKSTAEMCEGMYKYKKTTTSRMIATAKYFLTRNEEGELTSYFGDIPLFNLFELLQSSSVMENLSGKLVQFYQNFNISEMRQDELRDLKKAVKQVINANMPLTLDSYHLLETSDDKEEKTEQTATEQTATEQTATEQATKVDEIKPIDRISGYLAEITTIFSSLPTEEKEKAYETITAIYDEITAIYEEKSEQ